MTMLNPNVQRILTKYVHKGNDVLEIHPGIDPIHFNGDKTESTKFINKITKNAVDVIENPLVIQNEYNSLEKTISYHTLKIKWPVINKKFDVTFVRYSKNLQLDHTDKNSLHKTLTYLDSQMKTNGKIIIGNLTPMEMAKTQAYLTHLDYNCLESIQISKEEDFKNIGEQENYNIFIKN